MHIIPQLRKLERKFESELVVVGVHSAKFTNEKETENVRQAVLRHEIEHPVVNDNQFAIWSAYGVRAWPTIVIIDPRGQIVHAHEGEFPYEPMERFLSSLIAEFDKAGLIDRTPLKFEREKRQDSPLSFPGKIIADEKSGRLFISDTNHNRIVVTSLDGATQMVIGSGKVGLEDGDFKSAKFNKPQGIALDGDTLAVADTENHAIRRVDLKAQKVETLVGTGERAMRFHRGGSTKDVPLSSPWDLVFHNGKLYIAMAGFHQLWSLDLATGEVRPYAGSGAEDLVDGPLSSARLAQPSGIITDGQQLYFADSEASAIRAADLSADGGVKTIVGPVDHPRGRLFQFGDVDGAGTTARLQHPLGVAYHDGVLYICDTYNSKIKRVFPKTRAVTTFLGAGKPGYKDGAGSQAQFNEPGGLAVAGGKLYIADTNNHLIRVADLQTKQVTTLKLRGLK